MRALLGTLGRIQGQAQLWDDSNWAECQWVSTRIRDAPGRLMHVVNESPRGDCAGCGAARWKGGRCEYCGRQR